MIVLEKENLKIFGFGKLSEIAGIEHFVSGREGGVSEGEIGSLNLSYSVGDLPENVTENRKRVADFMGISADKLIFPIQTHTKNVRVVTVENYAEKFPETDALVTNLPGICIAVMSADCIPVLLADPVNKVVAAIHAGWRGTVQNIVAETIGVMKENFQSNPENIIAGIGPGICQDVYEVGEEVIEAFRAAFPESASIIKNGKTGKAYLNLWEANKIQLMECGVKPGNIETSFVCTFTNSDTFFSARKSKQSGRFAAGILIR